MQCALLDNSALWQGDSPDSTGCVTVVAWVDILLSPSGEVGLRKIPQSRRDAMPRRRRLLARRSAQLIFPRDPSLMERPEMPAIIETLELALMGALETGAWQRQLLGWRGWRKREAANDWSGPKPAVNLSELAAPTTTPETAPSPAPTSTPAAASRPRSLRRCRARAA